MSRNASGTYSLPAGNPVTTGTTISSTTHNATLSDLATEMTDSLSRSGNGAMLAPLEATDGAVGAPSITFDSEATTGFYKPATNVIGVSVAGTLRASIGTGGLALRQTGATANAITSYTADGATAVAVTLNTSGALANAAAKLLSVQNNSVEKASIGEDGALTCYGAAMGSQKITGLAAGAGTGEAVNYDQITTPAATTVTGGANWTMTVNDCRQVGAVVSFRLEGTYAAGAAWTDLATFPVGSRPSVAVTFMGLSLDNSASNTGPTVFSLATNGVLSAGARYTSGNMAAMPTIAASDAYVCYGTFIAG